MMLVTRAGEFFGNPVDEVRLESSAGAVVNIMTYGVVVRDWQLHMANETRRLVLGFENFDPYPDHSPHFGSLAGRIANRVSNGRFELDEEVFDLPTNEPPHSLHGGPEGLGRIIWELETDSTNNIARFTHSSPDGAMGYPGAVDFVATYRLDGHALDLTLEAYPDRKTPISLVQHQYFNLGKTDTVLDHQVWLAADRYTPSDETLKPTGQILPVANTQYDFSEFKNMRDTNGQPIAYDINTVLKQDRNKEKPAAEVLGPDQDLRLKLYTDRDALQIYNGVWTDVKVPGLAGKIYGKHSGLCLEDQAYPNAINQPNFPSILCTPDSPYRHTCRIEIAPNA